MKGILKILEKIRGENMTKAIDSNITDSEWEVMRVDWAQKKTTSKDIRDIIENKKNLKGSEFVKIILEQTFDNICNKDIGKIIADLISKSTLSYIDIEELEKVLEMKKEDAVDVVPCNCVPGQCNC